MVDFIKKYLKLNDDNLFNELLFTREYKKVIKNNQKINKNKFKKIMAKNKKTTGIFNYIKDIANIIESLNVIPENRNLINKKLLKEVYSHLFRK